MRAVATTICSGCGAENAAGVGRCAGCGASLVSPALAAPPGLVRLRAADWRWIAGLSERLESVGIPCRVEAHGSPAVRAGHVDLFVRVADEKQAREIDAEFAEQQMPDGPGVVTADAAEGDACPECGLPVPPEAERCPGCGLGFRGEA